MEVILKKLNIGFNADVKVVERNEFEITGDITMTVILDYDGFRSAPKQMDVGKLRVVYNHDGLLEHIYNGEPCVPDNILLFKDVETYVNKSHGGQIVNQIDDGDDIRDILLTDDYSINVFADITL